MASEVNGLKGPVKQDISVIAWRVFFANSKWGKGWLDPPKKSVKPPLRKKTLGFKG